MMYVAVDPRLPDTCIFVCICAILSSAHHAENVKHKKKALYIFIFALKFDQFLRSFDSIEKPPPPLVSRHSETRGEFFHGIGLIGPAHRSLNDCHARGISTTPKFELKMVRYKWTKMC